MQGLQVAPEPGISLLCLSWLELPPAVVVDSTYKAGVGVGALKLFQGLIFHETFCLPPMSHELSPSFLEGTFQPRGNCYTHTQSSECGE